MTVPSSGSTLATIAALTVRRLLRGRALWVCLTIALLPVAFAALMQSRGPHNLTDAFVIELLVIGVLPAAFVAASIGEEIEDRTTTYLWSRPLARWTVIIGKLIGLAPVSVVLVLSSWIGAVQLMTGHPPGSDTILALAVTTLAVSMVSAGISTLVPKHGMALTIVYMLFFDLPVGEIPASIQTASVTHQAQVMAHLEHTTSASSAAAAMLTIAGLWLLVGLWRVHRLES